MDIIDQLKKHPKAYFSTENGVLLCGDCLEIMKDIPDKSVDLVLTDPPYNASNSNIGFKEGYKTINADWDKGFVIDAPLKRMFELIIGGGSVICFCSYHLLGKYLESGYKVQQVIHWEYITAMPAIAKVYTPVIEYAVWFSTPGYTFNKNLADRNIIRCLKAHQFDGKIDHPSVKPIQLMERLLEVHSKDESIILDPFLGSGTTAVACEQLGRRWIGIEISERYCQIAAKRIKAEADQIKMF